MNEVFLIGKILSDVEFSFIINDKKKKSIVNFEMMTLRKQTIRMVAYNDVADYVYRKCNKYNVIFVYGSLLGNDVLIKEFRVFV